MTASQLYYFIYLRIDLGCDDDSENDGETD